MMEFDLHRWKNVIGDGLIDQVVIDTRRITSPHALFIALEGKKHDGHSFIQECQAKYIIAKKGKTLPKRDNLILVDDTLDALQEIAKHYRKQMSAQTVIIGGSYGKTMVKDLLHEIVATTYRVVSSPESFNSQIGVPLSLLTIENDHEIALIEAAFSKVGEAEKLANIILPDHGIITHLGSKHRETLGASETIAEEMQKLIASVSNHGVILVPSTLNSPDTKWDENFLPHAEYLPSDHRLDRPYLLRFPNGFEYHGTAKSGFYYYTNLINMTVKMAWKLGVSQENICHILDTYELQPMRTEIWKTPSGTTIINDSYCSDPQSIDCALKYFDNPGRRIFLFGGLKHHQQQSKSRIKQAIEEAGVDEFIQEEPLSSLAQLTEKSKSGDVILIKGSKRISLESIAEAITGSHLHTMCFINLAAVESNITTLRYQSKIRLMVMVKALAYGTDDVRMSKFLASCGVDILGVSFVDEGIALKKAGVTQDIFVLNATPNEAEKITKWNLEVGVSNEELIDYLSNCKVHLHVDTGMGRLGCRIDDALHLAQKIQKKSTLQLEGIMTHFAAADDPHQDKYTQHQIDQFDAVIAHLNKHGIDPPYKHAANSAGLIRFNLPQYNMARVGLAVYGLHSSKQTKDAIDLKLAVSLITRVAGINHCKAGDTIGYGRKYFVDQPQTIAVLPIGYYDGLHRHYSETSNVMIRGQLAPMVGNICMDYMMVDITHIPHVSVGDPVLIFGMDEYGHFLSPEKLAPDGKSIAHELITCLGPRIQRIFCYEETGQLY